MKSLKESNALSANKNDTKGTDSFTECETIKEAEEMAGFIFNIPKKIKKYKKSMISTRKDDKIQVVYQNYKHRNFKRVGEKDIVLGLRTKKVSLKCLLYSKIL